MRRHYLIPSRGYAPLVIVTSSPLPGGTQGSAYSAQMIANGGTAPYTWALIAGSLDTGLSLSSSGLISGTPANAETDTLTIRVTDSAGATAQGVFSLTVAAGGGGVWPNGTVNAASLNWVDVNAAA